MTDHFSEKVSKILAFSREEAMRLASSSVSPEHLLLGIIRMEDGIVNDIFNRMSIKKSELKQS